MAALFYALGILLSAPVPASAAPAGPELSGWLGRKLAASAESGCVPAQVFLAKVLLRGEPTDADYARAALWWRAAAEKGDAEAQTWMGWLCQKGLGLERSPEQAFEWYLAAAGQGATEAQAALGKICLEKGDQAQALKWLKAAAAGGNLGSQLELGLMYAEGRGTPRDDREAAAWFRKAALGGEAEAMRRLGRCYREGRGAIEDYVEAYAWFLLAVEYGMEEARADKDELKKLLAAPDLVRAQDLAYEYVSWIGGEGYAGSGTGFFVCPEGYFLTAYHVVEGANAITVSVGAETRSAALVCGDRATDAALLKVSGEGFASLPVVSSSGAEAGEEVFTVGFPSIELQGREPKYTQGVVSSLSGSGDEFHEFQVTVPIQPGNSGGPLLNRRGEVIGIMTGRLDDETMFSASGMWPQNVNYALKSDYLLPLLKSLPPGACGAAGSDPGLTPVQRARYAVGLVLTD